MTTARGGHGIGRGVGASLQAQLLRRVAGWLSSCITSLLQPSAASVGCEEVWQGPVEGLKPQTLGDARIKAKVHLFGHWCCIGRDDESVHTFIFVYSHMASRADARLIMTMC